MHKTHRLYRKCRPNRPPLRPTISAKRPARLSSSCRCSFSSLSWTPRPSSLSSSRFSRLAAAQLVSNTPQRAQPAAVSRSQPQHHNRRLCRLLALVVRKSRRRLFNQHAHEHWLLSRLLSTCVSSIRIKTQKSDKIRKTQNSSQITCLCFSCYHYYTHMDEQEAEEKKKRKEVRILNLSLHLNAHKHILP